MNMRKTCFLVSLVLAAASAIYCALASAQSPTFTLKSAEPKEELRDGRYPARWWTPVSKEGAPGWEILPQEAAASEVILSKRQPDLGLLSNFAATPFEFNGKKYASVEGF